MFLNLLGVIFASWEANFVSTKTFCEADEQRNIDRKHNVNFSNIVQFFTIPSGRRILERARMKLSESDTGDKSNYTLMLDVQSTV